MKIKQILKLLFSKENIFYTLIFLINLCIIIVNRFINGFHKILWLCDFSSIFGITNAIFAAKHKIQSLIFNLLSTLILIITNTYQHIWLNAFTCLFICTPVLILGIIKWRKNEEKGNQNLNTLSKKTNIIAWSSYILVSILFIFILKALNGNLYILDAFYSAGCVFGVILSSFAYINQFEFFIFANIFGIIMYVLLTIQNINNLPIAFMTIIYLILNIVSYINWRKLRKEMHKNNEEKLI